MRRLGSPRKVTAEYRERLVHAVRRRPRSLGLPFSVWTLRRLADRMAERTGIRVEYETVWVHLKAAGIVLSRPSTPSPARTPSTRPQKKAIEGARDNLLEGDIFYYADEFNLSWMPTLKAMWSPKGRQVMIPTPAQRKAIRHRRGRLPHRRDGGLDPPPQAQSGGRRTARSAFGEAPHGNRLGGLG
jgi:hypothetical protein